MVVPVHLVRCHFLFCSPPSLTRSNCSNYPNCPLFPPVL